jgi:hypothetical protein
MRSHFVLIARAEDADDLSRQPTFTREDSREGELEIWGQGLDEFARPAMIMPATSTLVWTTVICPSHDIEEIFNISNPAWTESSVFLQRDAAIGTGEFIDKEVG